ncbi:MAG: tRNA pseudouridine(13) synthase TruD [Planctomycetota bacterium]|nr:tRNA pseudouridine(13) synthase TruD [Planctomycetota bacterium]
MSTEAQPLPFLTACERAGFGPVGVKQRPEDFIVEEVPLYEPAGTGTHVWFWIEKRNLSTHDAARLLAKALGKRPGDAGFAGLKDTLGVTRQWLTFEHVAPDLERAAAQNALDLGAQLRVLAVTRHGNKLKRNHLRGNRFEILMRAGEARGALLAQARKVLDELGRRGVPNYYGPQRFGRDGRNAELGRLLVAGDEAGYFAEAEKGGLRGPKARDRKLQELFVNALQAELFNRVLARRMPAIDELWEGDLAWLHRNGAVFKVTDLAAERPRCAAFEVSPSGPIFGPKMTFPAGRTEDLERDVLSASGIALEDFGRKEAGRQPGARRPLRVPLLEAPRLAEDPEGVRLAFALPSGSYATVLLREIVGDAPLAGANA